MSKPVNLRSKLKAADRRRRRRPNATSERIQSGGPLPTTHTAASTIDVAGILADAATRVAETTTDLKDTAIVGALRAIAKGTSPASIFTDTVYNAMVRDLDAAGVTPEDRRKAAGDLLKIALDNVDPAESDRLIKYFAWIGS
ncbi:MAG: hypothetical protein KDB00_07585 [Planctomycetales bacterium]|nr:hypothetical protein [Planctomycetales bacterium]